MVDFILQETGEALLQENGFFILLERQTINVISKIFILNLIPYDNRLVSNDAVIKLQKGGEIILR